MSGRDITELATLQLSLLEGAAAFVKKEGLLIYATCSLFCEENEDIANAFLVNHPDFKVIPCGLEGEQFLSLSPAKNNTDGFIAAKFQKE